MKSTEEQDPYALYVRAYRTYCMQWIGGEPKDAVGQLAIVLGKQDGGKAASAHGGEMKTRAQLLATIACYNAEPIVLHGRNYRPRIRTRRRGSR